jgi:hypothetical protein
MPSPAIDAPMFWLVERELDSRYVGHAAAGGIASSFHHPAGLVLGNSDAPEKGKSVLGDPVGPQVVMGIRSDEGGVCSVEQVVPDVDDANDMPILSLNDVLFEKPIAGDACGVSW